MVKYTICLFTLSFPYNKGGENTFLENEVKYLEKYFDNVIIFPSIIEGDKLKISDRIKIDPLIFDILKKGISWYSKYFLKALFSKTFIKDFFLKKLYLKQTNKLYPNIKFYANALVIEKYLLPYFRKRRFENIICYTYWCTSITLGLGLIRRKINNIKLVTRAHGIDLYEERGSVRLRELTIKFLDKFYLISQNGFDYLLGKYPGYSEKYVVSRLGIVGPLHNNYKSDDIIRIVSCSNLDNNKQVDLIFLGILAYAKKNKKLRIEWHHFGDGAKRTSLEELISKDDSENLKCHLYGNQPNNIVKEFYKENYISLFINASISEGIPVSIMEAQSYGIPVIAPAVGGVPEIVNNENGELLSNKVSELEIADAIYNLINSNKEIYTIRKKSYKSWEERFNANKNYERFASDLIKLFDPV